MLVRELQARRIEVTFRAGDTAPAHASRLEGKGWEGKGWEP